MQVGPLGTVPTFSRGYPLCRAACEARRFGRRHRGTPFGEGRGVGTQKGHESMFEPETVTDDGVPASSRTVGPGTEHMPRAVPSSPRDDASAGTALVPEGTFLKVGCDEHPLPGACEVAVHFQDYHRSSTKLGRFGKIVGIDEKEREYLIMLDNFDSLAVPMRRVEWRKLGT